ncbi:MAG: DUF3842 family protein [Lachnospiraceae bacterium]|nr:DUF3842 family protein [Lachnospiraceae bacterium]
MNILVIDAQGGGIGRQLVGEIRKDYPDAYILAVGTNSAATMAMLKAGATEGATGENPVVVGCRTADIIVGPVGIVIADSLLGEITEKMAVAVAKSPAVKILLPFNQCSNIIAGVPDLNVTMLIRKALEEIAKAVENLK